MSANISCPGCNKSVVVPNDAFGKNVRCPSCQTTFAADLPHATKDKPAATLPEKSESSKQDQESDRASPTSDAKEKAGETEHSETSVRKEPSPEEETEGLPRWLTLEWRRIPVSLSFWLLVPIFFLPWVNVSCNEQRIMYQSGLQTCIGTVSYVPRWERIKEQNQRQPPILPEQQQQQPFMQVNSAKKAYLIWVFASFILLACFGGLLCVGCVLFRQNAIAALMNLSSLACMVLSFFLLVAQMIIGFPIADEISEAKRQQEQLRAQPKVNNPGGMRPLNEPPRNDLFIDIDVTYTNWFWAMFTYLLLLIPWTLMELVATGFVIYRRKGSTRHQESDDG